MREAMDELRNPDRLSDSGAENGGAIVGSRTIEELWRLARSNPTTGQGASAKLGAIRARERLNRLRSGVPELPPGWHPHPEDGWAKLDACDSEATRRRWWANLWAERRVNSRACWGLRSR